VSIKDRSWQGEHTKEWKFDIVVIHRNNQIQSKKALDKISNTCHLEDNLRLDVIISSLKAESRICA
jgi:RNA-binding protein YlmH